MSRNESSADLRYKHLTTMQKAESRRRAEQQKLIQQQAQIRGSLRISKLIDLITDAGFYGGFIGGLAFAASGSYEASIASLGITFSSLGIKFGRNLWSVNNEQTIEDLDNIQERLHRDYNIPPDQGFFDRARQKRSTMIRSLGEIAALRRRSIR